MTGFKSTLYTGMVLVDLQKAFDTFPHCKKNLSLKALSYISPSLWNNQDKFLGLSAFLNTFKQKVKDYYFRKENKTES